MAETVAYVAAIAAGLIHVGIFVLESVLWRRPAVHRLFGVRSLDEAETNAFALLNQGFYNLFLALGAFAGVLLAVGDDPSGVPILFFTCLMMAMAAAVLVISRRSLWRGSVIQGAAPMIALVALLAG